MYHSPYLRWLIIGLEPGDQDEGSLSSATGIDGTWRCGTS